MLARPSKQFRPPPFMSQLSLLKTFSNETKRKKKNLVQEYELGVEAAEKRLAGIWKIFGLETEEEKKAKLFMTTFAYLFHLLLFCSLSPIGRERLGGIKKTKGTHFSRFFLKMLIYTLSIDTESCTSSLKVHKHEIFFGTIFAETESIWSQGPVTRDF
jgi:hypothetical protein